MQDINIWSKLHLHRYKIIFAVLLMWSSTAQCQYTSKTNLPHYDDKFIHYGFTLGLGTSRFTPTLSKYYLGLDTASAIGPNTTMATIGFVVNFRLDGFWDFRVLPTVAFYQRSVKYKFGNASSNQITESTFIELPLLFKYKSQRRQNMRMFVVGGLKPGIEAGAKKKEKKDTELRTQNIDLSIDYGFGFDIYYPFFVFSPELRFSHGLLNMLVKDPNPYSQSLNRVSTHSVTLYLHFN